MSGKDPPQLGQRGVSTNEVHGGLDVGPVDKLKFPKTGGCKIEEYCWMARDD